MEYVNGNHPGHSQYSIAMLNAEKWDFSVATPLNSQKIGLIQGNC